MKLSNELVLICSVVLSATMTTSAASSGSSLRSTSSSQQTVHHRRQLVEEVVELTYFDDIFKVLAGSVAELKLGPGEDNSYDFTLYKEWTRKTTIGASTYKCTNTKTMYEAFCNGQVSLTADSGGTIQLQGLVSVNSEDDQVLAIIGGTGKYIGARGQVVGVKQTAQGGIKHSATFSVWTQNEDADEATVTESSIPKASGNSTAAATTSTTKKAPATKATTTKKTTATKKTNSTKSS